MNLTDSINYYNERLARLDPDYFSLSKLQKPDEQIIALNLFSLNLELSIIPVSSQENMVKIAKFNWWRERITVIETTDNAHPLLNLTTNYLQKCQNYDNFIKKFLENRERDYYEEKFNDNNQILHYIDNCHFLIIKFFLSNFSYDLTEKDETTLKSCCYFLKFYNILRSLNSRSYNNHPFISNELLNLLKPYSAARKNEEAKKIIKNQAKEYLEIAKGLKKSDIYKASELCRILHKKVVSKRMIFI